MQGTDDNPRRAIAIFLVLTFLLSAITWVPQISAGELHPLWILGTMWAPGVAAILTKLVLDRSLKGMGWVPRPPRLLGLAYILPLLYALPVYAIAWAGGLGTFDEGKWIVAPQFTPVTGLAMIATAGLLPSLLSATGEEIGWRGFLVPQLLKVTNFRNTALISGLIWAVWHMPLILFANYHGQGTSIAYSLLCFTAMVVGFGFVMAWITVKSRSLWPAALLHASHNLFVQSVFDQATVERDTTQYWTSEFGVGLALAIAVTAILLVKLSPPSRSEIAA